MKSFPVIALFALLLFGALLAFGCVEQKNGEPTPPALPSETPGGQCFFDAARNSCCIGDSCMSANVDCVEGFVPRFKGCDANCAVIADCEPAIACTMEAKSCPDGSAVGRVGPDCAFAPCPSVVPKPSFTPNPSCPPITISCWCPGLERVSCPMKQDASGCSQWDGESCPQAVGACSSDNDCVTGGCSGELCGSRGDDLISPCIWREEFACYKKTTCGCVQGACAWKSNAAFYACLNGS